MGKIVDVLGLGPSLDLFEHKGNVTIGVNDIWSRVRTDYVVCVDAPDKFTFERLSVIENCKPIKFYSHLDDYKERPDFEKIELQPYYPNYICQLDIEQLPKSHCSPFIAAVIAFKYLEATEIHLYGVDLINHPNLKDTTTRHIKTHFINLKQSLKQNNCNLIVHGDGILKNI